MPLVLTFYPGGMGAKRQIVALQPYRSDNKPCFCWFMCQSDTHKILIFINTRVPGVIFKLHQARNWVIKYINQVTSNLYGWASYYNLLLRESACAKATIGALRPFRPGKNHLVKCHFATKENWSTFLQQIVKHRRYHYSSLKPIPNERAKSKPY